MHTNGALKLTPSPKEVAQGEVQLCGVGVKLDGLYESINGLVLLLVEQIVQAFEIGFGVLAIFKPQLSEVQTRSTPSQCECHGKAQEDPTQIKFHGCHLLSRFELLRA